MNRRSDPGWKDPRWTDPRLTDEQLKATFTPQQWEFFHWHETLGNSFSSSLKIGEGDSWWSKVAKRFPTKEEQYAYFDWIEYWVGRVRRRIFNLQWTVDEYIDLLKGTTYNNAESVRDLTDKMNTADLPSIFIGTSDFGGKNNAYAIAAGNAYLWPHLESGTGQAGVLRQTVLGINLNVPIHFNPGDTSAKDRRRQQRSSGEDSVESAESDDAYHAQDFTFVQIGALCVFADDDWERARGMSDDDFFEEDWHWDDTGFGVVVEVKPDSRPGAVWVIYGFHEVNPESSPTPFHIPVRDSDGLTLPHIGRLYPDSTKRFTVAKIAHGLEDLRQSRHPFEFQVESTRECQLVEAKLTGNSPERLTCIHQ